MSNNGSKLNVGVIGCGRWGPNHIRVFSELSSSEVLACADTSQAKLDQVKHRFPAIRTTTDYHDVLDDQAIDAVVVATPTDTHALITREALKAGKHVLTEKPLCTSTKGGRQLAELAEACGRVLMVGHVFLFNDGIIRLRELVQSGELGEIHYLDAVRTNLGPIRSDVNALYDLATHDISIFNYLLGSMPIGVAALGSCISQPGIEDVCFATLKYPQGTMGHIHVSWLNPRKVRTLTVVGSRKMAHWDDVNPSDALCIYDKGIEEPPTLNSFGEYQFQLRSGDMHVPAIQRTEPLVNQARAFTDWVLNGKPCGCGPAEGLEVVAVLEAAVNSMNHGGAMCRIEHAAAELQHLV